MFKFNKSQFDYHFIGLLSLSKATIKPVIKYVDPNGQVQRAIIPTAVARKARTAVHGVSRFAEAYPACIAVVAGKVVALELPNKEQLKMWAESGEWIANIETQISLIHDMNDGYMWDGQYIYRQDGDVVPFEEESSFGSVKCHVYDTYRMGERRADLFEQRAGLAYKHPQTNKWVVTCPVVRQAGNFIQLIGDADGAVGRNSSFVDDEEQDVMVRMNKNMFPNLRFVNYAARVIVDRFNYESIEPLGLPLMMIEHRTFNLGSLNASIQMTSPAPFKFDQGLAWCIGLFQKVRDLDDLIAIKSTLKMYLSKGTSRVMTSGSNDTDVPTREIIERLRTKAKSAALLDFSDITS